MNYYPITKNYDVNVYLNRKKYISNQIAENFIITVEQDVDRLNNPEDSEIIETYVLYNYGCDAMCEYEELPDKQITITSEWNIENYR